MFDAFQDRYFQHLTYALSLKGQTIREDGAQSHGPQNALSRAGGSDRFATELAEFALARVRKAAGLSAPKEES